MIPVILNSIYGNRRFDDATVITVDTRIPGLTAANQYRLPFGYESSSFPYNKNKNVIVDWGDGTQSFHADKNDNIIHTYAEPGVYEIAMSTETGSFIGISQERYTAEATKLLSIEHWGSSYTERNGLVGCTNIDLDNCDDAPVVFTLVNYFRDCINLKKIGRIEDWETSNVSSWLAAFRNAQQFEQDLSLLHFDKDAVISQFMQERTGYYNPLYYDNLLQKWAESFIGKGRTAVKNTNMGTVKYTAAGAPFRAALIADGWSIADGGQI